MSNSILQARALVREHWFRYGRSPAALYVGREDFKEMADCAHLDNSGEFYVPFKPGERVRFRNVPIYQVDEDRHMAVSS